ncbi:putative aspartate aminotransferase, partial [Periconia macrospinosa]
MSTLSTRGQSLSTELDKPWQNVNLGPRGEYDPDTNPLGVVTQFASAENQLIQREIADFIRSDVSFGHDVLSYKYLSSGSKHFSEALAIHLNQSLNPYTPLSKDNIAITSSATAVHEALAFCLMNAGEGILLSRPHYGQFVRDFGLKAQVKIVGVEMPLDECFQPSTISYYETALEKAEKEGVKIKAVLIVNPHNPLGKCYPQSTLTALQTFCQRHKLHLISDEIYALSVFSTPDSSSPPFASVLSLPPILPPENLHVIYGMSKSYAIPGLALGTLLTHSTPLLKSLTLILPFVPASTASLAIGTALLSNRTFLTSLLATSRARLADAYTYIAAELDKLNVPYVKGVNAGFFVFVDLSAWMVDGEG